MKTYLAILLLFTKALTLGPSFIAHHHHDIRAIEIIVKHDRHYHDENDKKFDQNIIGFLFSNFFHGQDVKKYIGSINTNVQFIISKTICLNASTSLPNHFTFELPQSDFHINCKNLSTFWCKAIDLLRGPPTLSLT